MLEAAESEAAAPELAEPDSVEPEAAETEYIADGIGKLVRRAEAPFLGMFANCRAIERNGTAVSGVEAPFGGKSSTSGPSNSR